MDLTLEGNLHLRHRILSYAEAQATSDQTPSYVDLIIIVIMSLLFCLALIIFGAFSRRWRRDELDRINTMIDKVLDTDEKNFREKYGYSWDMVMVFRYTISERVANVLLRERGKTSVKRLSVDKRTSVDVDRHPMHIMVHKLKEAGLQVKLFYGINDELVYCKIRAPIERLLKEADRIHYRLQFDSDRLLKILNTGNYPKWMRVNTDPSPYTAIPFTDFIFGKFYHDRDLFTTPTSPNKDTGEDPADKRAPKRNPSPEQLELEKRSKGQKVPGHGRPPHYVADVPMKLHDLFVKYRSSLDDGVRVESILKDTDRILLIHSIITDAPLHQQGCRIQIEKFLGSAGGTIKDYFPLHDYRKLFHITGKWQEFFQPFQCKCIKRLRVCSCCTLCWCCCSRNKGEGCCFCPEDRCPDTSYHAYTPVLQIPQIIEDVREYFGEEVGMQALFLNHLTNWLGLATFVGALVWIHVAYDGNDPNALDIPFFSGFVGLWSTLMLEYFKRAQSSAAMRWGTYDCEFGFKEVERHDFDGDEVENPINGRKIKYKSP